MLDPIKATVVTPGLDLDGTFAATGVPASIVTKFLAEHGVVVEKTGLYSFFIMFTIGITKGRWNTMVTELQRSRTITTITARCGGCCRSSSPSFRAMKKIGLKDLCDQIHGVYRANDVARLTTEMYLSDMQPAMPPGEAWARMAHRKIERVDIDKLEGRVTQRAADALSAGHPLADPGRAVQCHHRALSAVRAYVQSAVPGFETDIHGLVTDRSNGELRYFVDACAHPERG